MPLSPDELDAIRARATCFQAGTYGTSGTDLTPTAVVAQMRDVTFDEVWRDGRILVLPRYGAGHVVCDAVTYDLAVACGCGDRVSYAELIETVGLGILALFCVEDIAG